MSKLNKSSKAPKPPVSSESDLVASKPPAKESQKLELVKLISPPVKPEPVANTTDKPDESTPTPKLEVPVETTVTDQVDVERSPDISAPDDLQERNLPIPPATEPMQYRAIGLVQGRYTPEAEQFSKGNLVTPDGTEIDAVLLGKVISIVKKRLDLSKDYYWVVYPRTRDKTSDLHVQITGVWAPLEMGKPDQPVEPNIDDGYFSVRGEVTAQSLEQNQVYIKVRRTDSQSSKPSAQKKDAKSTTKFKIALAGILPANAVGQFWDINAQRQGNVLNILDAKFIANIPSKGSRKPFRKPDNRSGSGFKPKPRKYGESSGQSSYGEGSPSKPIPRSSSERPSRPVLKKNSPGD
jgi:hypothetical protein